MCIRDSSWFKQLELIPSDGAPKPPELPLGLEARARICGRLQSMDIDIRDYRLSYSPATDEPQLLLSHGRGQEPTFSISFQEESAGVKKLLGLIPSLIRSLEEGTLLMADDLDSFLHPQLLRALVRLYTARESNRHNAQLLFTSHNTAILTPADLRRDEIWLCCRSEKGEAHLYPLTSYKKENGLIPRNDEAYGKQYLEGRYGAIPHIR